MLLKHIIFIYLIYLANFLFLKNKIVFILFTSKFILLSKFYYIVFNSTVFNIFVIFCIKFFTAIMSISSINDKMKTGIFSSM